MRIELTKPEIKQVMYNLERMEADFETVKLDLEAAYIDANDKGLPSKALVIPRYRDPHQASHLS